MGKQSNVVSHKTIANKITSNTINLKANISSTENKEHKQSIK